MTDLTTFLVAMLRTAPDRLARANPDKLAAKYRISPDHARGYINLHLGRP